MRLSISPVPQVTIRQTCENVFRNIDTDVSSERAFLNEAIATGTGGNVGHVQLVNPAGSGIQLLLDEAWIYSPTTQLFALGESLGLLSSDAGQSASIYVGQDDGVSSMRTQDGGSTGVGWAINTRVFADVMLRMPFKRPFLLDAGKYMRWTPASVDTTLGVLVYLREL